MFILYCTVREHPVLGDFPSTGEMEILATGGIPQYWGNADFLPSILFVKETSYCAIINHVYVCTMWEHNNIHF